MQDLSLHILDIVGNSIEAGATKIEININENVKKNILLLKIKDNGKGMSKKSLKKVLDPFYTTKKTRRIGLGLSMLAQATKDAEGDFDVKSKKDKGTTITAKFVYNHIDRKPLGNMCDTIMALIGTKGEEIDFVYEHHKNGWDFIIDTRKIKRQLNGAPINQPGILRFLRKEIKKGLKKIKAEQFIPVRNVINVVGTGLVPVQKQPRGLSLRRHKRKNPRLKKFDYSMPYTYFVTICTKNGSNFFVDKNFNRKVIKCLISEKNRNKISIYVYCLMPDHLHLLVSPGNSGISISKFIGGFKSKSTRLAWERGINKLWQGRFYDHILRKSEDLKETGQYILNNPVRTGIVESCEDYEFCGLIDEILL